ncbi:MAG: hypothetical protein GY774_34330 [Planctomycetes bacterium]|nr:hypothetical protein [Planctomycetota bacterium]
MDYPLLGLKFEGMYFIDLAIAFGGRHGAKFLQDISVSVCEILANEGIFSLSYIDDIAGADRTEKTAWESYSRCSKLLKELGLDQACHKASPPGQCVTWLGITFNTQEMTMLIPTTKIREIQRMADEWASKRTCTHTEIRQFLGKLYFASTCNHTLKLFTNRLRALQRRYFGHYVIKISEEAHKDIDWIRKFLIIYNGKSMITRLPTLDDPLMVDSCMSGGGGHLAREWYYVVYPTCITDRGWSISQLEMLNVVAAIRIFVHRLQNHVIRVYCDNSAAVSVISSGKGECPVLLSCARAIWSITAQHNIIINVAHVEGKRNQLADELSRAHTSNRKIRDIKNKATRMGATILNVNMDVFDIDSNVL